MAQRPSNGDIRATLALSQEEARNGGRRVLNLPGGRRVVVQVRPGMRDGEEIRLPGEGEPAWEGGPAGDLVLTVALAPSTQYRGQDYVMGGPTEFVPASSWQEARGLSGPAHISTLPAYPESNPDYGAYPPGSRAINAGGPVMGATPVQPEPLYLPQAQNAYQGPTSAASSPYVYGGYPQRPRRRSGGWLAALLVVLVLILISGSGLLYYVAVYQPNQAHVQATATAQARVTGTAQAQARATATVQAQAQATANAQATVTIQATATATAQVGVYTQITSGTPALNDTLNAQSQANWDELTSSANGACAFAGGAYHSTMPQKGYFQPCYAQATNFSNFAFQVQMTIVQGDDGGIIFRADNQNSRFYLFRISRDGTYTLFLYVNNQGMQARSILNGNSQFIKTDLNVPNMLTVIAQGNSLLFYVDKQYVGGMNDNTYAAGKIGVFAESNANRTDVTFSNAQVWTL